MVVHPDVKREVREFYDRVGWQAESEGFYQNAIYEDLRPVSHEYIHRCHLRVLRHLNPSGRYLLDAGSGPIQYPEYLEYSHGYQFRVCADLSMIALQEARKRIGDHGLYVVCDIACLPFKSSAFGGLVSLHTIHHLPKDEHLQAYHEFYRMLVPLGKGVIVNGWENSPMHAFVNFWRRGFKRLSKLFSLTPESATQAGSHSVKLNPPKVQGTYVRKHNLAWLQDEVASKMPLEIWCWRSVSVTFMRTFVHPYLAGKWLLKLVYALEELFPHFLGKYGQYPLIVLSK